MIINVSRGGPTPSIQEAINIAVDSLVGVTEATSDIRINIGEGTYAGFKIPDGAFLPFLGTPYRVTISSGGRYFPIIDFNIGSESYPIGADLGSANPNITIENVRIQYFAVGIRALANCHELKISKCLLTNNRNSGAFIEHSEDIQVIQSIVVNGDYGIVTRLCKNTALIHNTVFLNGSISSNTGTSVSGIWCEAGHDFGSGLSDTGTIHLIGNIVYNTAGRCVTLFYDDVQNGAVVSNFNDFVRKIPSKYIILEDRVFYSGSGSSIRTSYTTLQEWKAIGMDLSSVSSNPGFLKEIKVGTGRNIDGIDLFLLNTSSILTLVPSFYVDAASTALWLPSYVDSADLSSDIINNTRNTAGTAAGSNDKESSAGFYGQDIFLNPLDISQKDCSRDPLYDLLGAKNQKWYPKINKGYFYGNDREYYLYASKIGKFLGDIAVTEFVLPKEVALIKPIYVYINGRKIESTEHIDIIGNRLRIWHKNLDIENFEEEVDIECSFRDWAEGDGFSYSSCIYRYKIRDGITKFFLSDYIPGGPIVVTDDKASPSDPYPSTNREFSVINTEGTPELVFANSSNLISNGQFDYNYGQAPILWESQNATVELPLSNSSCYGNFVCRLSGDSFIEKIIKTTTGESCLSFHSRGTGNLDYSLEYLDHNYDHMGYRITGTILSQDSWKRYYLVGGAEADSKQDFIQDPLNNLSGLGFHPKPDSPTYLQIHLGKTTSDYIELDGIQYEESISPSLYHRKPFLSELTVEYEGGDSEYFIDTFQSLSPVLTHMTDGFLYIGDQVASSYGGPRDPSITTLHEIRWPEGRIGKLPWARTIGYDKLKYRPNNKFHLVPQKRVELVTNALSTARPKEVRINPNTPVCRQGDSNGIGISIQCIDEYGNPHANNAYIAYVYDSGGRFPGWLFKTKLGLKEQLSQSIIGKLDSFGAYSFIWIPPSEQISKIVRAVPKPKYSLEYGRNISVIKTKYPVINLNNVVIKNETGQIINIFGDLIKTTEIPRYVEDNSVIQLPHNIKYNSLSISISGIRLEESEITDINSDQFYIDYPSSTIYIKGRHQEIHVEYIPLYLYLNEASPRFLLLDHDQIFGGYEGNILVGHDYKIELQIQIEIPGTTGFLVRDFDLVAQNSLLSENELYNSIALEI